MQGSQSVGLAGPKDRQRPLGHRFILGEVSKFGLGVLWRRADRDRRGFRRLTSIQMRQTVSSTSSHSQCARDTKDAGCQPGVQRDRGNLLAVAGLKRHLSKLCVPAAERLEVLDLKRTAAWWSSGPDRLPSLIAGSLSEFGSDLRCLSAARPFGRRGPRILSFPRHPHIHELAEEIEPEAAAEAHGKAGQEDAEDRPVRILARLSCWPPAVTYPTSPPDRISGQLIHSLFDLTLCALPDLAPLLEG